MGHRGLAVLAVGGTLFVFATAASGAGVCDAPPKIQRTSERVSDARCDASCGPLQPLHLAYWLASGTPTGPASKLEFVDQWHAQCEIHGGVLHNKCKADTGCAPGSTKFQVDGVWKCKKPWTRDVMTPEQVVCQSQGQPPSCPESVAGVARSIEAAALTGNTSDVQAQWRAFTAANLSDIWFTVPTLIPGDHSKVFQTGYAGCAARALHQSYGLLNASRSKNEAQIKEEKSEILDLTKQRDALRARKDPKGDVVTARLIQEIDANIRALEERLKSLDRKSVQLKAALLDAPNIAYARYFIDYADAAVAESAP